MMRMAVSVAAQFHVHTTRIWVPGPAHSEEELARPVKGQGFREEGDEGLRRATESGKGSPGLKPGIRKGSRFHLKGYRRFSYMQCTMEV